MAKRPNADTVCETCERIERSALRIALVILLLLALGRVIAAEAHALLGSQSQGQARESSGVREP
jgi:hypothetical protein